jgi:hypothetical protein
MTVYSTAEGPSSETRNRCNFRAIVLIVVPPQQQRQSPFGTPFATQALPSLGSGEKMANRPIVAKRAATHSRDIAPVWSSPSV